MIHVFRLADAGDARGNSFGIRIDHLSFLRGVKDIHVMTLLPGHIRGDHYHVRRREAIVVVYRNEWSLFWDMGENTEVQCQSFSDSGAVLIGVEPGASHAIRNDGADQLQIIALSDEAFDPSDPDTFPRQVAPGGRW